MVLYCDRDGAVIIYATPPVLPEMVLFLMLRVPPLNTPPKKILRSESNLKRQSSHARVPHGHKTESGRVPLASDRSAVTFNSDLTGDQRQTDGVPNWP